MAHDPHDLSNVSGSHDNVVEPIFTSDGTEDSANRPNLLELAKQGAEGRTKAAMRMVAEWNQDHDNMKNFFAQWKVNRAQREGITGAYVIKNQDDHIGYIPLGSGPTFRGMNKAYRLARRLRSQIFSDPPAPEIEAEGGTDEERDAAEFSVRVLDIMGEPDKLDFAGSAGDAFDLGSTYGSGFRHFWVDPKGGGHRPMEVYVTAGVDPYTEQPYTPENPGPAPVLHYMQRDKTLSMEKTGQEIRRWLPKVRKELLTGKNVRFIPHHCEDVSEAQGVRIGTMVQWGTAKAMFPELEELDDEQREKIMTARVRDTDNLMPKGHKHHGEASNPDERFVFVLTTYYKSSGEYPRGAYLVVLGDDYLAHPSKDNEGFWYDQLNDEPLDIPLDQFAQYFQEDNPYHKGALELLAPGNEIRSQLLGSMLEHLDRFRNRKWFVPMHSNVQAQQLQLPTATYIPTVPGGEPKAEVIPNFPRPVQDMLPFVTSDMDDEVSIQEPAQGKSTPSVDSGVLARQLIEQTIVGLSDLHQNAQKGMIRGWKITLQLVRAFYTVPQRISWTGEDGCYKEKMWRGVDLTSAKDVKIRRGTMTMMSPSMKTAAMAEWLQLGWVGVQEAKANSAGYIGRLTGAEDNPHRMRVRRQVYNWMQGPPEGFEPPQPQIDPQTQQPIPPPNPVFPTLPVDMTPEVAQMREYEMGRAMSTTKFEAFDPVWQGILMSAYSEMRQAAGIMTIQEQQQAAQQQQQAEQAALQNEAQMEQQRLQTSLQETQIQTDAEIQKTLIAQQGRADSQNAIQ